MASNRTHRVAFSNRTNEIQPILLDEHTLKRRVSTDEGRNKKRVKVKLENAPSDDAHNIFHDDSMDVQHYKVEKRSCTFSNLRAASMRPRQTSRNTFVSTRPILTTFVSSRKSDIYNLHSEDPITPGVPFACAFSAGDCRALHDPFEVSPSNPSLTDAKKGGMPILAVALQDGTVELLNVSKREDWEPEPQRTIIRAHTNAILDVKWGFSDQTLATASGDSTIRITAASSQHTLAILDHHKSSVKTLDWDPNHADILSSAGRDGSICVWDLRTAGCTSASDTFSSPSPVVKIPHAHHDVVRGNVSNLRSSTKTVTSLLYLPQDSRNLVSSGSFNGILKQWDLRYPMTGKAKKPGLSLESRIDPTLEGGFRGRGISSLALGRNHSAGTLWALAADSSVYNHPIPISAPFAHSAPQNKLSHPSLYVTSFYVKLAVSPCGRWLASGSSGGGVYVWDVATQIPGERKAVELRATGKEIGAVDWAKDCLAACCDDGTVKIWKPNFEVSKSCRLDPNERTWDWVWANDDVINASI